MHPPVFLLTCLCRLLSLSLCCRACCLYCMLQVEGFDASSRAAGTFNQPQFLALREQLGAVIDGLDKLQV